MPKYDFCGWATKNDLRCGDGRIIRRNAFQDNDGTEVPLVWNHCHNSPDNVLGHALLENRDSGVYAYCTFNSSESGQTAKQLVRNRDVTQMSIYANKLQQKGPEVMHGIIREVSLVLAGANPGAQIESVLVHGEEDAESGIIYTGEELEHSTINDMEDNHMLNEKPELMELSHAEDGEETVADVFNTLTEKQKKVVYALIGQALSDNGGEAKHSAMEDDTEDDGSEDETVGDVFNTLSEKQKKVVYALIGKAIEDAKNGGKDNMKHNLFDTEYENDNVDVLTHSEMEAIFDDCKRYGSLKEAVLQHGITNIDYLFPDAQNVSNTPEWLKRNTDWVATVLNGTKHTPFSRIKSMYADLTEDDARALGYIKGNMKKEEFFSVAKRTTTPTTIYKKQKIDRDDVIDITDFDVVAWLKGEMRGMLDEEIARAILVGDGRNSSSDDKINEQNIRPIWTDNDIYTVKKVMEVASSATDDQKAKAFIKMVVKSHKDYKGSGNKVLFTTEDVLTDCLLMEDSQGRVIYDTEEKLRTALRVNKIVTVPVMENKTRTVSGATHTLMAIMVDLGDYNVGADKGGAVNMFDDFDIDYNAQKYLIETRCSGALIKPYSAVVYESKPAV